MDHTRIERESSFRNILREKYGITVETVLRGMDVEVIVRKT